MHTEFFHREQELIRTAEEHLSCTDITVNWRYHEDNDIALECGEEFQEDVSSLTFNLRSFGD